MDDESGSMPRRSYLRRIPSVAGSVALAGCSISDRGGEPTRTPRESTCSDGDSTDVPTLYANWLAHFGPAEYEGTDLVVTAAVPKALAAFPEIRSALEPYLLYLVDNVDRAGLEFDSLDRVLYARPPGSDSAAYFVVEDRGTPAQREAWLDRLRLSEYVTELPELGPYERRSVEHDAVRQIGFDDDHILVAPAEHGPVALDAPSRIRRLVETARGDEHPLHCYDPDVRALVKHLPRSDLTYAKLRTDSDAFGADDPIAPPGARAAAFTLYLRWARRELFVDGTRTNERTTNGNATDSTADRPLTGETAATPTETPTGPEDPQADLALVAVFPDEADVDAVRDHADERWTNKRGEPGVGFDDPEFEADGRVVTVSETRSVQALLE